MGINRKELGFTIIETTVVLGISSLLMVAVLVGSSMAVNQQRYRDSVMSLVTLIQGEYTTVTRVQNPERSGANYDCSTADAVVGNGTTPRGTSDCVIIGRAISVSNTGKIITTTDVIGSRTVTTPIPGNDVDALQEYQLSLFDQRASESEVAWGAAIFAPGDSAPSSLGILLLRSPVSGSTLTFVQDSVITSTNIEGMVNTANIQEKKVCVDSQGLFGGPRSAVIVHKGASGPNGVEQLEAGSGC